MQVLESKRRDSVPGSTKDVEIGVRIKIDLYVLIIIKHIEILVLHIVALIRFFILANVDLIISKIIGK